MLFCRMTEFIKYAFSLVPKFHLGTQSRNSISTIKQMQLIVDEKMLRQKVKYIHMNPIKRGYVDLPEHWLHSSAHLLLGQESEGEIDICMQW